MVVAGRPLHSGQENFLLHKDAVAGGLKAEIHYGEAEDVVELRLSAEGRKVRINGKDAGTRQLPGPLAVSVFTPADLRLIQGSPQERRRFVDYEVSLFDRSYAGLWRRYQRALWQKNKALARAQGRVADTVVWDEQLAYYGARIIGLRNAWLSVFCRETSAVYREISEGGTLTMEMTRSFAGAGEADGKKVERALLEALAGEVSRRGSAGVTVGPHREDLKITVDGTDSRYCSSQGEQRTLALALRLAGHVLRRRELGEDPLLLLDDAFYELDGKRRKRFLDVLAGMGQVLAASVAAPGEGRVFYIEAGTIKGGMQ